MDGRGNGGLPNNFKAAGWVNEGKTYDDGVLKLTVGGYNNVSSNTKPTLNRKNRCSKREDDAIDDT